MSDINRPELRAIENEQIRIFRIFMEDRDPKHIAQLVELKRRWDEELGLGPAIPPSPAALNGFSLSRKLAALRRYGRKV
jgi:hypothetical protein